jgi:hypothetical protein
MFVLAVGAMLDAVANLDLVQASFVVAGKLSFFAVPTVGFVIGAVVDTVALLDWIDALAITALELVAGRVAVAADLVTHVTAVVVSVAEKGHRVAGSILDAALEVPDLRAFTTSFFVRVIINPAVEMSITAKGEGNAEAGSAGELVFVAIGVGTVEFIAAVHAIRLTVALEDGRDATAVLAVELFAGAGRVAADLVRCTWAIRHIVAEPLGGNAASVLHALELAWRACPGCAGASLPITSPASVQALAALAVAVDDSAWWVLATVLETGTFRNGNAEVTVEDHAFGAEAAFVTFCAAEFGGWL